MGLQQSQVAFPYDVGEAVVYSTSSLWKLHKGVRKSDGAAVSIFAFDAVKNAGQTDIARNALKRIKTLRFPSLLGFSDGLELESTFYIVTEEIFPLQDVLVDVRKHPHAISLGLYQMLQALAFMNGDCKLLHGSVLLDSIFVNKAGDWKLGAFDLVCSIAEEESLFKKYHGVIPQKYKPPEVTQGRWPKIQRSSPHTIDVWMLGNVIYELYNGPFEQHSEIAGAPKAIPKVLAIEYKKIFSPSPESRPEPSLILNCKYFSNSLVQSCVFLENIAIKEPHEKEEFFKKLPAEIEGFPKAVCTYKMLPSLVNALDYGYANSRALGPLLKIGSMLTAEEYSALITPSVVKWFASNDREMRMNLLSGLESFVEHLSPTLINQSIFANITTGFTDISPKLRELTVRSVVLLAPKLNANILNGEVLRYFAKLQLDKEDYIRTNTTICLGRVARYLEDSTRKKVLTAAFSRALRDPFGPARLAGVMAFGATYEFYDADEIAKRVVPALSYLSVDQDKQVRVAALQKLKMFVERLEKASLQMPDVSPAGQPSQQQQQSSEVASGSLISWAFVSISKTIYGDAQEQNQAGKQAAQPQTQLQHTQPVAPTHLAQPVATRPAPAVRYSKKSDDEDDDASTGRSASKKKKKALVVRLESEAKKADWGGWDDAGWDNDDGGSKSKSTATSSKSNNWDVNDDDDADETRGGDWGDNDSGGWEDDKNSGNSDWGNNAWGNDGEDDIGKDMDEEDDDEDEDEEKESALIYKPTPTVATTLQKSTAATTTTTPSTTVVDPGKANKTPSKGMGLGGLKKVGTEATKSNTSTGNSPVVARKAAEKDYWGGWGESGEDKKMTGASASPSSKSSGWGAKEETKPKTSFSFAADEEEEEASAGWGADGGGWGDDGQAKKQPAAHNKATTPKKGGGGGWGDDEEWDWDK